MENLFEELKRIKSLMIYEQGTNIYEVSTSSAGAAPEKAEAANTGDTGSEAGTGGNGADDPGKKSKKNCVSITNTERYNTESDVNTEVPEKFFQKFKAKVEEQFGLFEDGEFTLEDINVFGGASNYWRGSSSNKFPAVEPKYCNEYDVNVGIKSLKPWGAGCKGYNKTPKATYDKNSAGKKKNEDLAKRRAEKVLKELTTKIITYAKEKNIKVPENYESEIKSISSGSIYSLDKTDTHTSVSTAINSGELNAGQFVMIDAILCFTPNEPCPKCMVKDPQTKKCKCKEGLTEKDGKCYCPNGKEADENCECNSCPDPCMKFNKETKKCECPEGMTYNEETKQCECPKGFTKNENCECIKGKEEETCPDKCMKRDADGKCKCPEGMTYNEQTKVCDCPEGKIKPTADACNCTTPKPPLKCNYEAKKEGARGTKQNNFVAASLKSSFPAGAGNKLTISFDSLVVPDAFYIKYGDQEFFSGFMGDVYNIEYKQVAFSDEERKKMLSIQPKSLLDYIKGTSDEDYSSINNIVRNFVGELIYYKQKEDLLGSINAAIKTEGGKLVVSDLFKNGDSDAEKITNQIKVIDVDITNEANRAKNLPAFRDSFKTNLAAYANIMKAGTSFTINKETENLDIVVLVFSPLDRTIFNISVKCE